MTHFVGWKRWLARIFQPPPSRARRRPKGDAYADVGLSLESRELLSADALMGAFVHFGSAGAAGHDLTFGRSMNPDFGGHFAFDRGDRGFGRGSSQSTNGTHLVLTVEPTDGTAGQSSAVTVSVEDANGNVVSENTANVTLRVADGPGDFSGGQTLSATAVNGVATFNDVVLDTAGTHTLVASSRGAGRSYSSTSPSPRTQPTPANSSFKPDSAVKRDPVTGVAGAQIRAAIPPTDRVHRVRPRSVARLVSPCRPSKSSKGTSLAT